jgi:CCR4-NOT transcriptional regulation complex NOT5 subunit
MLEYIFFHKQLLEQFLKQLEQHDIPCETRDDAMGLIAAVSEDLDDERLEQVDKIYDALLDDTEMLLDSDDNASEKHAAAITLNLKNGDTVEAPINPALLKRVLSVISYEELNELVEDIVDGVENPDHRPFCQR